MEQVSKDLFQDALGDHQDEVNRTYRMKPESRPNAQTDSQQHVKLLKRRPLVPTNLTPSVIIGDDFDIYYEHLEAYKKSGLGWDDFVHKARISPSQRRRYVEIIKELNANGYYGPEAIDGDIVCYVAVEGRPIKKGGGRKP